MSGRSCRAEDSEEEYFIKRFLSPKYPIDGAPGSKKVKENQKLRCAAFERRHRRMIVDLKKSSKNSGNLVCPIDFFREGSSYYKVSSKIDKLDIKTEKIARLDEDHKYIAMLTALNSLSVLHSLNYVHGDLKPDNILIKATPKSYSAKLIDFDDSYISGEPPEANAIVGDQVYFSPETELYIRKGSPELGKSLTCKSDLFALGIIFHEYWTGPEATIFQGRIPVDCSSSTAWS